ncbi:hypothetical protein [Streptomyces sp. STR69]|uniref:hypothetical protein n=1 Tax=Streptomyces sp. STR69 TaxID=1796942 RepID=UPI003966E1FB
MVMRGFIPGAVRTGVVDPHGPTPTSTSTCPHARAAGRGVRRAVVRTPSRG